MLSYSQKNEYYQALVGRNSEYEGVFFAGIKSTGIFCRPTCTARKPKMENCDFFRTAQEALLAGYRSCKRCCPLSHPNEAPHLIKILVEAVEAEPEKRWGDADFRALGVDSSTVRRQFKKRFGMTFVAYARARRMGLAMKEIRNGETVINAQINAGYESGSGFRDAFSRIMGVAPNTKEHNVLKAEWIDTRLGPMIAMVDDSALYLLEFADRRGLEREVERLRRRLRVAIVPGRTTITDRIEKELTEYFTGSLKAFETPIAYTGSDFQKSVWEQLRRIPYGQTRSYAEQAKAIGNPSAVRAVARANGANQLAVIVPCHRVIGSDGKLTGYAGGLARKQWLLENEQSESQSKFSFI